MREGRSLTDSVETALERHGHRISVSVQNDQIAFAGFEIFFEPRIAIPDHDRLHRGVHHRLVPVAVDLAQRVGIGSRRGNRGVRGIRFDHTVRPFERLAELRGRPLRKDTRHAHRQTHAQRGGQPDPRHVAAVEQQVEFPELFGHAPFAHRAGEDRLRLVQIVEETAVNLLLAVGHVFVAAVAEMGVDHRAVVIRHTVHDEHLENLRNGVERGLLLRRGLLQPVDFRHDVGVGELPHGAVPAILQVVVRIVAPALQRLGVVHVAREHVRIEVLNHLERPVLALAVVVVEIDALLDDAQAVAQSVVVGLQFLVRDAGLVVVQVAEITRAGPENDRTASGEEVCTPTFHP